MLNRDNTIKIGAMAMSIIIVLIIAVLLNQNSIPEQSQTQTFPVSDAPAVETSPEPAPQQEPVVTPEPTPAEISENSDDSSSGSSHNLPILPTPKIETPSFTVLDFNDCPDTGGNWTINSSYQLNTSISCDNINITGGSTLEIYNESVHIQSNYIYIENASTLTHRANTVSHLYDLDISVINLTIESGGSIDVDEKGFYNSGADTGFGPGGGTDGETSSGGGYGGKGGRGGGDGGVDGGDSYGSLYEPTDLGSAGGDCKGSDGGGAIFLNVSDTLTNNGIISSDSARPPNQGCDSWSRSGSSGGSGGSVYIITNSIYGAGTITANGGDGSDSAYDQGPGAGGGGGRIAIYYTDDYSNMTITAQGGARLNSKTRDGGAGTIYLQGPGFSELIVDNLGRATSETTLKENLNVDNLTIKNGAIFKINYSYTVNVSNLIADSGRINNYGYFNADNLVNSTILGLTINNYCGNLSFLESSDVLTIGSGSTLTLSGCEMDSINPDLELTVANDGVLGHLPNYGDYEYFLYHLGYTTILNYSLNLTLPKISVESGGLITANGVGYSGGQNAFYGDGTPNGPGAGNDPYGNSNGGSGGAYGGDGGFKQIIAGGQAYGTIKNSFDYGSAGGDCNGGNGGGMIYLNATFLEVNGTISSDGESGANYGARRGCDYDSRDGSGGGSGGSILIDAQTIRGNGSITSNGGIGGTGAYSYNGYAGGGGRIAIYYNNTYFTGDYISRSGSWGKIAEYISPYGGAGTIYIKGSESEDEYLIIDNQGYNSERETPLPNDLTIYNLSIERGAELTIDNETTLNVTYLNGSGTLNLFGTLDANNFINSDMSELTIQNYNGNLTFLTESNYFNITSGARLELGGIEMSYINPNLELTVKSGGTLSHVDNVDQFDYYLAHLNYDDKPSYNLNLTLPKLTIESGASIDVTGKGWSGGDFRNNTGIGFGAGSDPSVTGGGSGGGYGGFGSGTSTSNPPGSYYGSMVAPFYLGSGGGDCTAGHGGGAVYLNISTLILDGSIISSGSKGGDVDCDYLSREGSGGGSGGSIYIITKNISGSGNLVAEGGNGGDDYASDNGGSGGGGRIALYALDDISSLSTSTAGGRAPDNPVYEGDSGTLFICNSNGSFYCYGDGSNYSFVRTGSILQNTIFSITHTNEINRTFNYAWNQTYLKWSDEATDSSTVATYNITGLLPSTDYYIIDNSLAAPDSPKSTDGTGQLELFNISLSSPHEIEVLEADPSIIPAVTLEYPVNLIEENTRTITYRYSVTSSAEIASCSLYIGESLNETDNTITIDINQTFTVALDNGEFNWSVNCIDMFDRQGNSSMGYFNISAYLNLTVNLDPNPAENEQEVTVSGHVNTTGGEDAADTLLDIFLNGTSILPDWSYKQPINITENTGSDLDEYQVNVSIDTASLISAGKMSSNCSDIKFEDTEGNNLFYWIEDDWDQIDYATSAQGATCSGGTSCTNAIDNAYSISNYWEIASPQDETLTELGVVDLGAIKDIGRISIHLYDGNTRSYYNYAIQVSEDNVNWNTWFNGTGSGINYQSLQTITHDVENVRYIKVFISGSTSNAIGHIIELYAYEKANSCNSENTKIWINTNLTASTEETVYMYYGNDGVESASNGTEVFDFFDNFNDASIGPEWTHDAGSAVEAGGVIVLKGDELYGNFNGVPGYTVEALAKKTTDNNYCAVGFSGWWNSNPSNVGVSTISGWGTGDVLTRYSGDGAGSLNLNIHKWTHYKIDWIDSTHQTYYANENSRAITHASYPSGLPTPGLAATDGTDTIMEVDWVFVRKYASAEPTINLGIEEVLLANTNATGDYVYTFAAPATNGDYEVKVNLTYNGMDAEINDTLTVTTPITVTTSLIGPTNNNYSVSLTDEITFECNASVSGPGELINITLYHNIDGTWIANGTEEITGTENSTTFTKNITDIIGANKFKDTSITWNCLAQGTSGNSDWGDSNYIFSSWDLGSYDNITLNSNNISLIPNNTGQYENQTGTYISKIYNAGFEASWNNLTWDEALPYGDEGEANRSEVVAYYKFNENALDSSGNGNDATITGNVANISGKLNGAYYFDGNGDYVSNSNISFMSSYTLSAWMKADSGVADGYKSIISRGAIFDSNTNFAFGLRYANPNHQLFLYYDGGTLRGLAPTIEDPTAEWHHVAARFDETNNEMAVYLDGIQVSSYVQPDGPGDGGQSLKIGSPDTVDSTDDPFSGSLDEVLIYNRILSDSEVLDLYKRGINKLNISTRTCNDASCDTETYDVDCTDSTFCDLSSLTDNQYFQYKVNFETEDTNYTPELLTESVEIEYGPVIENPPEILTIYPNSTGGESSESITIVNVYISEPENQSFNITYNNESAVLIRWFVDDIEQIAYQNLTQYDWTGNYTQNGTYDIFVNVSNDAGSSHQYWNLDINNTAELPSTTEYYNTSETTDFSSVPDVASVVDMVLGNTYANITWSSLVNAEGLDFDNYMEFGDRYVYVNSASLDTSINSTALVTLKGVDCDVDKTVYYSPTANTWTTILNENTECPDTICTQITCEGTTISFYVQHFSGFASGANANLTIDHDGPKNTDVNITFDAFYVNKTSGDLVTGAECNITFEDDPGTTYPMIELADKYRYNKSFSSQGTYNYNVTCDQAEFSLLNASDSVEVTVITAELAISDTGPEFVNANVTFDANYTNKSSDLLITGAVCNISFSDNPGTTYSMIELSDIYQYNKSFSTHNSYDYTIICDSVDSTYLTDTSFLLIISSDPDAVPEFSTITMLIALTVVIGGFVMIRKRELY